MAIDAHYDTPEDWAVGADPAYEALSRAIVAASPVPFGGRAIVDLGAGTGATCRAIAAAGGRPIAVDLALPMLSFRRASRPPAVVGDISALPLGTARAGGVVAAFSLSHADDPAEVLCEAARVTAAGGPVLAGGFAATGARHEAAAIVESLATALGWRAPDWYLHIKSDLEPQVARPDMLTAWAEAAGLAAINVTARQVDAALDTADALVRWRLSGPALASFVARLPPEQRANLWDEARRALGPRVQPWRPAVCILSSVAAATR